MPCASLCPRRNLASTKPLLQVLPANSDSAPPHTILSNTQDKKCKVFLQGKYEGIALWPKKYIREKKNTRERGYLSQRTMLAWEQRGHTEMHRIGGSGDAKIAKPWDVLSESNSNLCCHMQKFRNFSRMPLLLTEKVMWSPDSKHQKCLLTRWNGNKHRRSLVTDSTSFFSYR